MMEMSSYRVEPKGGLIQHFRVDKGQGLKIISTFCYPNCSISVSETFFFIQRCLPISARETELSYEVYRHNDATDEEFERIDQVFKQVMKEDKELCNAAQKNLDVGIYTKGNLHSRVEKVRNVAADKSEERCLNADFGATGPALSATSHSRTRYGPL